MTIRRALLASGDDEGHDDDADNPTSSSSDSSGGGKTTPDEDEDDDVMGGVFDGSSVGAHREEGEDGDGNDDDDNNKEDCENDDDDGEEDDDDDPDTVDVKPYGRRSLAWTKRYRRLNPYETVRRRVLRFGHRSKLDWDDCVSSGQMGQYVPSRPDEMYAPEWVSWDEFLGLIRPYEETRNLAVNVLQLTSLDGYILFVHADPLRAEELRIPARPDLRYKDRWIDEEHFFRKKDSRTDEEDKDEVGEGLD
jgi:hypothetical protein